MPDHIPIPVIDLFSGPGGLGEGFASLKDGKAFRILVSAEMNSAAHETLRLRAYFRKIRFNSKLVQAYYDFCNGKTDTPWNSITKKHWDAAGEEALQLTLGTPQGNKLLDKAIKERLPEGINCVLIGGPPCQAYSLVGRARNKGKADYRPEDDHRHFLYKEYLRVIQRIKPAVFVMENVKGILSSRVNGVRIFHEILRDLSDPEAALSNHKRPGKGGYRIHSLTCDTVFDSSRGPEEISPADFVVRAESHGIPQARHRVILVGVRDDIVVSPEPLQQKSGTTVAKAINDMPRLRSRISKGEDSSKNWKDVVSAHCRELAVESARCDLGTVAKVLQEATRKMSQNLVTGGIRYPLSATKNHPELSALQTTLRDPKLSVVLNHEARGHMLSDLRRYAYVAAFTAATGFSPKGHAQFQLSGLRPNHANWESGKFSDRFRAQGWENPSSTITSHISKDGHYFIHPDVAQCRSLTVREAARLQTFPDNYFFQGNRTEQFHQVGNAVPPLLATMIAQRVASLLRSLRSY